MQDSAVFQSIKPPFSEQEQLKCPRCESNNTKFCYYNNYNLSQPRHFCKTCRRYWTRGGTLRNIPVGGGTRKKSKKASSRLTVSPSSVSTKNESPKTCYVSNSIVEDRKLLDIGGSFSSLLASNGQFVNPLISENSINIDPSSSFIQNATSELQNVNHSESLLLQGDSSCWSSGYGWPDLSIYTPSSSFQ